MNHHSSAHAIVLASWERNSEQWLGGEFFELRSKKRWLQERVGNGGTLWIVVSRPTGHGRLYSVSFRLNNCQSHTYSKTGKFGEFAVIGDPKRSKFFATEDARHLLLALRFSDIRPINGPADNQISNSLRVPRLLNRSDIGLLVNAARADRWSTFISYERTDSKVARALSEALELKGLSVFRDLEVLRGGQDWWPTLKRAISRSQRMVVLIGRTTHQSDAVRAELAHAFDKRIPVVPVMAGGDFRSWGKLGEQLSELHAPDWSAGIHMVVAGLS